MSHSTDMKTSSSILTNGGKLEFLLEKYKNLCFFTILAALIILEIFMMPYYRYNINPDCISYMSIAQKYASGDFHNAVNGYWGPLYSWLLVPFILSGFKPYAAVLVLHLLISMFTLIAFRKLSFLYSIPETVRLFLLLALIPVITFFALDVNSPDLLFAGILLYYFYFVFSSSYVHKRYYSAICGAVAGLAYLTKAYAFMFFVAHFALVNIYYLIKNDASRRKTIFTSFVLGALVFAVICSPWIYIISVKYQKLTFSTSGSYNFALFGPVSKGHPMHYAGFLEPSNETAVSIWEDISNFPMERWSPFNSTESLKYLLSNIYKNTRLTIRNFELLSYFTAFVVAGYMLLFLFLKLKGRSFREILNGYSISSISVLSVLTAAIYLGGYVIIYIEHRYLWPVYFILLLLGGQGIGLIFKIKPFTYLTVRMPILLITLWMLVSPPIRMMSYSLNINKDIYDLSQKLSAYSIEGNIASNGYWHQTLYLAYFMGLHYYGEAREDASAEDVKKEIEENKIDYYFLWNDIKKGSVSGYSDITKSELTTLKILTTK